METLDNAPDNNVAEPPANVPLDTLGHQGASVETPQKQPSNQLSTVAGNLPDGLSLDVFEFNIKVNIPNMNSMELFNMASRFLRYRDYNKSAQYFLHLIQKEPTWHEPYINLGNILMIEDKIQEAIKFWKKAVDINPKAYKAYSNLGKAYYKLERKDEAIAYWLMVATMQPDNYWNLFNLASVYFEKDDNFKYLLYLQKFLKICLQRGTAEYIQAKTAMTRIEQVSNKNYQIAQKCQKAMHYQGALKAYKQIVHDNPWHFKAQLNLGALYYKNKRYEEAVNHWLIAYMIDKTYLDNIANIAVAYEKMDKKTYAWAFYERYNSIVGEDSFEVLKFKDRIAVITQNKVALDPEVQIHLSKGDDYMKKQEFHLAKIEYENYRAIKPDKEEELNEKINNVRKYIHAEEFLAESYFIQSRELFQARNIQASYDLITKAITLYPEAPFRRDMLQIYKSCSKLLEGDIS